MSEPTVSEPNMERAHCAIPFCRRTAAKSEGFVDGQFLCGPHWRLRSPEIRDAWRAIERRRRSLPGSWMTFPPASAARISRLDLEAEERVLWERTRIACIEIAMGVSA